MAGFAGCITDGGRPEIVRSWLKRAGGLLCHTPQTRLHSWDDGRLQLAVAQLPSDAGRWSVVSEGEYSLFVCGAVDNLSDVAAAHLDGTFRGATDGPSRARVLLALYRTAGARPFAELNGPFVVGIVEHGARTLRLITDSLGMGAICYAVTDAGFLFASEMKALLAHPAVRRTVDEEGLAHFLAFDHCDGDRTLYQAIRRLPGGTLLAFDAASRRLTQERFWTPRFATAGNRQTPQECADELARRIRAALRRDVAQGGRIAVPLSGGMDSRILLGLACADGASASLHAFTTGHRHTYDVVFARRIARACGVPFRFVPIEEDYLARQAPKFVWLTDGMVSAHHGWQMGMAQRMPQDFDRVLLGYIGGVVAGYPPKISALGAGADPATIHERYVALENHVFTDDQSAQVLRPDAARRLRGVATHMLRRTLQEAVVDDPLDATRVASLLHIQPRAMGYYFNLYGSRWPVETPLADQDVMDYWYTVPPAYRLKKQAYNLLVQRHLPHLAGIAIDKTGLPLDAGLIRTAVHRRWKTLVKHQLPRWSGGFYRWHDRRAYAHYNEWMRRPAVRQFVDDTLARAGHHLEPWFEMAQVRQLAAQHLAGELNVYRQVSALLTLCLWFEQAETISTGR